MKNFRIAISGKSGCGNTTIGKLTADMLGAKLINFTFRSLAEEKKIDFLKVLELAENDSAWDREVDSRQVKLAMESDGCVLSSRLAIWLLKDADLKVYLYARPEVRAQRIVMREGGILEAVAAFTNERDLNDHERYLKIYGIDNNDYRFADLIIDTDKYTPQQITGMIVDRVREHPDGNK
ncbi:MAG: cytidylate kinase family protein [Treponema sp.]|nr:cytidylate kinase family protein [Treponema sp.]